MLSLFKRKLVNGFAKEVEDNFVRHISYKQKKFTLKTENEQDAVDGPVSTPQLDRNLLGDDSQSDDDDTSVSNASNASCDDNQLLTQQRIAETLITIRLQRKHLLKLVMNLFQDCHLDVVVGHDVQCRDHWTSQKI